jgi:hypothetical protein
MAVSAAAYWLWLRFAGSHAAYPWDAFATCAVSEGCFQLHVFAPITAAPRLPVFVIECKHFQQLNSLVGIEVIKVTLLKKVNFRVRHVPLVRLV